MVFRSKIKVSQRKLRGMSASEKSLPVCSIGSRIATSTTTSVRNYRFHGGTVDKSSLAVRLSQSSNGGKTFCVSPS